MNIKEKRFFAADILVDSNFEEFSKLHEQALELHIQLSAVFDKMKDFKFEVKLSDPTEIKLLDPQPK